MSEKRASSGSYAGKIEPKGGDALARLSDHLGRLLAHADELLAEWQGHADGVRARLDVQAREAGAAFQDAVEDALAEAGRASAAELEKAFGAAAARLRGDLERARQAAADLDGHMQRIAGGARPSSVDELRAALAGISGKLDAFKRRGGGASSPWGLILAATANLLLLGLLALVWSRGQTPPPPTQPQPQQAAPITGGPAQVPAAAVAPDAPPAAAPPHPAPCSDLAGDTTARVVNECVAKLCGVRVDGTLKAGAYARALAACKPEDAAGRDLLAALQVLERDKVLERLACPLEKDAAGRPLVTVRWLLDCPLAR